MTARAAFIARSSAWYASAALTDWAVMSTDDLSAGSVQRVLHRLDWGTVLSQPDGTMSRRPPSCALSQPGTGPADEHAVSDASDASDPADAVEAAHTVTVSQLMNEFFAREAGAGMLTLILLSLAEVGQQAQDLGVQPHQRHGEAEGNSPRSLLGGADAHHLVRQVEILEEG